MTDLWHWQWAIEVLQIESVRGGSVIGRPELLPDFDWGDHEFILQIFMLIMVLFMMFIVNFGIPFLMTKGGIGIGDRIIKRKSQRVN